MSPNVWERSEQLFHAALQHNAEDRTAFVTQACADDAELRAEVLSLLECLAAADEAVQAAPPPAAVEPASLAMSARRIGAYRIEREIGHGGMGAVFLASRADDQYRKNVAIKVVRADMATSFFAERLRSERQILAELEHPNIARLLDGGVTPDGLPFLVMEHVDGVPIDLYCSQNNLAIAERLQLFRKICGAVHYAHQRLVIHRDLKPANILVTAAGEPKLLDFGIAKLIEQDAESGDTTELMLATPLYASPELMKGRRATTASDVYSLGVILYALLTGHAPYSDTGGVELLNAILSGDIARPSAVAGEALKKELQGDLDNIVLRALRTEPEARYASAELLAEDVRRHQQSLPVAASGESFLYDARKFVRRNRGAVAAGAVVALSLLAATGVSLYQSRVAARERRLAQERLESLRKLTGTVLFQLHDSIQMLPGATQARKLLVQIALEYLGSLDPATTTDPNELAQIAEAYRKIADVQGNPTNANLGDTAAAIASYAKAREISERLVAIAPASPESQGALALLLQRTADTVAQTGDIQQAVATSRKSVDMFVALAEQNSSLDAQQKAGTAHIKLGDLLGHPSYVNMGDRAGALDHYYKALAIYERLDQKDATSRRFLGIIHERIGRMLEMAGKSDDALASYERSFVIRQALAADYPANTNARHDLAVAHEKIGDLIRAKGPASRALPRYQEALKIFEALRTLDPSNAIAKRAVAIEYEKMAETLAETDPARARQLWEKAAEVYRGLAAADPLSVRLRSDLKRVAEQMAKR